VKRRPRHIGLDEIQRGKGQRFWTVLSDVVHGEVIGLRQDRSEATATALLAEDLTGRQRAAITAVCTDMHRPYLNAVGAVQAKAEIVFDKFHVLQHASAALDEVRRQEFFRAGPVMREHGRGKRWLLLRRWKTVRGSKRVELQTLFAANRRLFKAYVLREQLDQPRQVHSGLRPLSLSHPPPVTESIRVKGIDPNACSQTGAPRRRRWRYTARDESGRVKRRGHGR
jgi:transposase